MIKSFAKNIMIFVTGITVGSMICIGGFYITDTADAALADIYPSRFSMHINDMPVSLNESFIKDGRTYVQLRELCDAANIRVDWRDPRYHSVGAPGGAMPEGINLTNSSYVYVNEIFDLSDTSKKFKCVDMTVLKDKYKYDGKLAYSFSDDEFIIKDGISEEKTELQYYYRRDRYYLKVEDFKEKILPYMVEICMQ